MQGVSSNLSTYTKTLFILFYALIEGIVGFALNDCQSYFNWAYFYLVVYAMYNLLKMAQLFICIIISFKIGKLMQCTTKGNRVAKNQLMVVVFYTTIWWLAALQLITIPSLRILHYDLILVSIISNSMESSELNN